MNRKEHIAVAALRLFAERGYEHTSTQLIAREADVSESLIFRHFGNKEQLLAHVIKSGYQRVAAHNRGMLRKKDPLDFIHTILDFPEKLVSLEPEFWKLQYRLLDTPPARGHHEHFIQPVHALLVTAFSELGYKNPEQETRFVLLVIDALWKSMVVSSTEEQRPLVAFIKDKYRRAT